MDDDVYKMRQDQSVTVTFPLVGREGRGARAHRGATRSPGRPRPWTLPTNLALAVGPDIEYAVVPAGPNGTPDATVLRERTAGRHAPRCSAREYLLAADPVGNYAKDLGYDSADDARAAVSRTVARRRARAASLRPALGLLRRRRDVRHAERLADPRRRLRRHRRGHRHRAPGARLRRGRPEGRASAAGIPVILSLDDGGRFLPDGHRCRRAASGRREQAAHPAAARRGPPAPPGELRALLPALLALPQPAHLQGGLELVRARARVPRPHGRAQPADQLGARERQGRPVRQVARATRATGRSAATATGARPIPVWKSDDPEYPRVDVYGSLDELERDFGTLPLNADGRARPAPPVHRRADPAEPRRPDRAARRCAASRTCSTSGSTPGSMPFAQVHYPFENREWFDTPQPGRLHRRVHRADPRLVLRACTCCRRRCSTARRSRTCSATASCSAATGRRCRSRCATTPTSPRSSTATARMRCAGS